MVDSAALPVPIRPPKNPAPPRHLPALPHTLLSACVLPHPLAGGLVLLLEMVVLRVVPTGAEFCFPRGLLLLGEVVPVGVAGGGIVGRHRDNFEGSGGEVEGHDGHQK